jgi:ureidoacrylate peracid hydrolase
MKKFTTTALLIVDLQNDFLHPKGAYARGGMANAAIAELPTKIYPVAKALRSAGGWIVSTQFTLIPGKGDAPMISPHLKALRPFLKTGDFAPGSWGQSMIDELQPADLTIEKVAYSAFYMTRMEWVLRKAGITDILVAGIVSNGGVASTVRDAHVRDFSTTVLSDGCAAHDQNVHNRAIADLGTIARLSTCAEALITLKGSV